MRGREIKATRERLGLTQEEFAREVGVVARTVSRWETDEAVPSKLARQQLERLAMKKR